MMRTFEEQIVLSFYDVDLNQNGRLPNLIAVAMLVAENHLKQLQLSEEWLLEHYQLVWVVTGHQLRVYRLPVYREQVCIKTEVIAYNRYFCLRGFTFYGKTGEVLLEVETSFVLINPVSRQLVGMPKELLQGFQEISEKKSPRYVTFSPSRSVRCETNKPPAMRVRIAGYTKKLQTRYNKGVQAYCKAKGEKYGTEGT